VPPTPAALQGRIPTAAIESQFTCVAVIDLFQRAVTLLVVTAPMAEPVAWFLVCGGDAGTVHVEPWPAGYRGLFRCRFLQNRLGPVAGCEEK
jgi:hypothetical protein